MECHVVRLDHDKETIDMSKKNWYSLMAIALIAATVLSACGTAAATEQTQQPAVSTVLPTEAPNVSGTVGVVLPTKDEPRWIQDETRFREALTKAGYDVEIVFSQGDSATEKANVEALIGKGIKVLIICPQDGTAASAAVEA